MSDTFLYEKIEALFENGENLPLIPGYVTYNLPKTFNLREYQKEALRYFIYSYETSKREGKQLWNLFHMATGAGKTNMMSAIILYLYGKGYRNFIFFVNATNIVEKTKENFLNKEFKKYLFTQDIVIDRQRVEVNNVTNFANADSDAINIMFTTIQGLHDRLNTVKENSVTYYDFKDKKIVLIADEAHHFSASTKKRTKKEQEEENTWEDTITKLYKINKDNILLEFTATCDLKNKNIVEKYTGELADIVYNYPLLKFRESGYTKDLINLKTTLSPIHRTLQAMLLSQYRLKLFEKNGIANSKPVILLKAHNKIEDLEEFYDKFIDFMDNSFNEKDINKIRNQANGIVKIMFDYYAANGINDMNLVMELKQSFTENHIIKVHSKIKNIDELQIKLNDLENKDNPYRMIMTLDMLHEGWDVLNLFDIVRLNDEKSTEKSTAKSKATTTQEAQLIGRGARYFPFTLDSVDNKYKRKFDDDLSNEMRICETLCYHCIDDSKYINEIRSALKDKGFDFSDPEKNLKHKAKPKVAKSKPRVKEVVCYDLGNGIPDYIKIHSFVDLTKRTTSQSLYPDIDGGEK